MDLIPEPDRKRRLALNCDALRLMIEFSLRPGEFARIGSSPAVEITLPMVGIREEECRIFVDDAGLLWMSPAEADDPVSIEPPSSFQAGPYHFTITEQAAEPAPAPRAATVPTPPAYARPSTAPIMLTPPQHRWKVVAAAAAAVAAALLTGGVLWWVFRSSGAPTAKQEPMASAATEPTLAVSAQPAPAPPKPEPAAVSPTPETLDLEKLAQRVRPCVFLLQVRDDRDAIVSTGTGFAITSDGMVATNHHVIKSGGKLEALTEQGAKFSVSRVIAEDAEADLAILQLEAKNLTFLPLGTSTGIAAGKRVAVYGSPVGLAGTLSEGIISAIRKEPGEGLPNKGELLQTTAPVSRGSSGSPLLDAEGNVLGVITLGSSWRAQNLNFAVPVEALRGLKERASVMAVFSEPRAVSTPTPSPSHQSEPDEQFNSDPSAAQLSAGVKTGKWAELLNLARGLAKKYPDSSRAHFWKAFFEAQLGLDEPAESSYQQSLALDPDNSSSWGNLGLLLLQRGDAQKALSALSRAAAINPRSPGTWANIARCSILLKDWRRAASALERELENDSQTAWYLAGQIAKLRIPDSSLQRAVKAVLAHKQDNTLYDKASPQPDEPEFFIWGVAAGDTLAVRSGPGTNFARITSLANGVNGISVIGEPRMNGSTEWVPIRFSGGDGWVRSKYLKLVSK